MKMVTVGYGSLAALNKASSDPLRLQILRVLARDAFGVLELCQIFEHRQSGMSHHLKVLAEVGLVAKRREGNSIFYSRGLPADFGALLALQKQLFAVVDTLALSPQLRAGVARIKRERAAQSRSFFERHANQFKWQQDLIADYSTYGEAVVKLLQKVLTENRNRAIEIGPGQGEFLPALAKIYQSVLALDNSPALLEQARRYSQEKNIGNVEFVCGDTRYLKGVEAADCIVMNMVLHHTPSPAEIFQDIAGALDTNGIAIITELCRHDQDWVKTSCGDLWMGFEPDELQAYAASCDLKNENSHYFALRNGFQIQLQQFVKKAPGTVL